MLPPDLFQHTNPPSHDDKLIYVIHYNLFMINGISDYGWPAYEYSAGAI